MPDIARLFPLATLLHPPSALALKGEFPDCKKVFMELSASTAANRKRACAEFISLCRIITFAWMVWTFCVAAVLVILAVVAYNIWAARDLSWLLISSLGLNGTQVLCIASAALLVLLVVYYFIQISCNQKAQQIRAVTHPGSKKR
jgi:hypothetical protein